MAVKNELPKIKKETKKAAPIITEAEKSKRDAKRKALKAKANKDKAGKNVSLNEVKKLKLTDLYGIDSETESYLKENGIDNLLKLSIKNTKTMTKKFINEMPALKSFTHQDKKQKFINLVNEAEYMVKELTK